MREEQRKIIRDRLKKDIEHVIKEMGKDGLFEDDILDELYLDLMISNFAGEGAEAMYLQAEFESQRHQKRVTLKDLAKGMIEFCDYVKEDYSKELRQAAEELEELAKMCTEAADRHAVSGLPPPGKG